MIGRPPAPWHRTGMQSATRTARPGVSPYTPRGGPTDAGPAAATTAARGMRDQSWTSVRTPERAAPPPARSDELARAATAVLGATRCPRGRDETFLRALAKALDTATPLPAPPARPTERATLREQSPARRSALLALLRSGRLSTALQTACLVRLAECVTAEDLPFLKNLAQASTLPALGNAHSPNAEYAAALTLCTEMAERLDEGLSIVNVSMEVGDASPSGGIRWVVDAELRGAAKGGHRSLAITPYHAAMPEEMKAQVRPARNESGAPLTGRVHMADGRAIEFGIGEVQVEPGATIYFIWNNEFFSQDRSGVYAHREVHQGEDGRRWVEESAYGDEDDRKAFFGRAVPEALRVLGLKPDVVQFHESHTAPALDALRAASDQDQAVTHALLHNLGPHYQGRIDVDDYARTQGDLLPASVLHDARIHGGVMNLAAHMLRRADAGGTVSLGYQQEVLSGAADAGPEVQAALGAKLAGNDAHSVANGIDTARWNPATDPALPPAHRFSPSDRSGKARAKAALQSEFGLPARPEATIFGCASRMVDQKGFRAIESSLRAVLGASPAPDVQFVFTGDGPWAPAIQALADAYPAHVAHRPFRPERERAVMAGSDAYLMPSEQEPSGQSQLIALRYGSIPVVTPVAGLAETVADWRPDTESGYGFVVQDGDLTGALERAHQTLSDPAQREALRDNAMAVEADAESTTVADRLLAFQRSLVKKMRRERPVLAGVL